MQGAGGRYIAPRLLARCEEAPEQALTLLLLRHQSSRAGHATAQIGRKKDHSQKRDNEELDSTAAHGSHYSLHDPPAVTPPRLRPRGLRAATLAI